MTAASISARLERLPPTRGFWRRVVLLSLGGFFEFYDMFLTAYVAPGLVRSGLLSREAAGFFDRLDTFVASFFAGLFIGTALFGFIADRLGRRAIFTFSLLWYAATAAMMAFQTDGFWLDFWRLMGGIGIGIELVTIDTYLAELSPQAVRGRAFAFSNVIQFASIPLVALLAFLLVPREMFGLEGWRIVVLIGAGGAAVAWWVRARVPESPRWLAQHGRDAEADIIVTQWEVEARIEHGELPDPVARDAGVAGRGKLREAFSPQYRSRTLMLIAFNLFQAAGYYGFASWVPTLLISQGIEVTRSLGYTFIIAIAAPFGPLLGLLFTDRVERKWIIVGAALSIVAAGLAFAQAHDMASVIACGVALTLANNILSFAYHGYQPELFPTRIRAAAVGFVYSFSRLSTMFSAFVIAFVLNAAGAPGVFLFIAGCMAMVAFVIGVFGPRTHNLPLEAISQ